MQLLICCAGALAIANIYYWYRSYSSKQRERERRLRDRVAYLLWTAAGRV